VSKGAVKTPKAPQVKSAPGKGKPAPAAASKARQPAKPAKPVEKKHDSKPAKKR
jgi:hypothetical protein